MTHKMEAVLVLIGFLDALKIRAHVDTDGWTGREKEVGYVDFSLEKGRIGPVAPLINKVKITNAVAAPYPLEIMVYYRRVLI